MLRSITLTGILDDSRDLDVVALVNTGADTVIIDGAPLEGGEVRIVGAFITSATNVEPKKET